MNSKHICTSHGEVMSPNNFKSNFPKHNPSWFPFSLGCAAPYPLTHCIKLIADMCRIRDITVKASLHLIWRSEQSSSRFTYLLHRCWRIQSEWMQGPSLRKPRRSRSWWTMDSVQESCILPWPGAPRSVMYYSLPVVMYVCGVDDHVCMRCCCNTSSATFWLRCLHLAEGVVHCWAACKWWWCGSYVTTTYHQSHH